jgi:CheY-like chemotaxis protein
MKTPTVLLAEDSEDDAYFFKWRFEQAGLGCVVHHVLDGGAAIEFLRTTKAAEPERLPCLMFLDLKMPVVNGFEVLSWLRERPAYSGMPVIVLSGSDQQIDKDRAFDLGAADYLVKPAKVADMLRYLRDVCPGVEVSPLKTSRAPT